MVYNWKGLWHVQSVAGCFELKAKGIKFFSCGHEQATIARCWMYTGRCPLGWNIYLWSLRFVFGKHLNCVSLSLHLPLSLSSLSTTVWKSNAVDVPMFDRPQTWHSSTNRVNYSRVTPWIKKIRITSCGFTLHSLTRRTGSIFHRYVYSEKSFPRLILRHDSCITVSQILRRLIRWIKVGRNSEKDENEMKNNLTCFKVRAQRSFYRA